MQTRPLSERNGQLLTAASRSAPYLRTEVRRWKAEASLALSGCWQGEIRTHEGFPPLYQSGSFVLLGYLPVVRILELILFRATFGCLSAFAVTPFSTVFPLYRSRPMDWVHHALHQVLLRWFPVIHKPLSLWIAVLPYGTSLPCELRGARFTCVPSIRALSHPDGRSLLLIDAGIEPAISA